MSSVQLIGFWLVVGSLLWLLAVIALVVIGMGWALEEGRAASGWRSRKERRKDAGRQGWIDAWGDEGAKPRAFSQETERWD